MVPLIMVLGLALSACEPPVMRQDVIYQRVAGAELSLTVYRPREVSEPPAAVLFLHGGGWYTGSRRQFSPFARALARSGYVAVTADYRTHGEHGTGIQEALLDALTAYRWLEARADALRFPSGQIVLAGGSAGGHLAACLAANCGRWTRPPQPRGLFLLNPVLDLHSASADTGFSKGELMLLSALGDAGRQRLSPLATDGKITIPTWLFFGTHDPLLDVALARLAGARPEIPYRVFLAGDEGHGYFNRPPWLDATRYMLVRFLAALGLSSADAASTPPGKVHYREADLSLKP